MQRPTGVVGFRVTPGEEQALESVDDIRITNIAFGEEVKGSGRTVVRVHHRRIPDFDELGDLDDLDDDDDDDDEDEDEDEDDEDEEDDDDDEEMDADEAAAAPAKKVNGKVKANGAASALVDTEAEVDDEDEESLLEEEEEHTYILCSLYPGKIEQVSVDLSFTVADDVRFSVSGENAVEILGNIMKPSLLDTYDEEPDDDELISDYGSDDESIDSDEAMYAELEGEDSEGEEDDSERIEEIDEDEASEEDEAEPVAAVAKPAVAGKKRSAAEAEVDISDADISMTALVSDAELAAAAKAAGFDPANLTKNQRKKLNKRLRGAASGDDSVEVKSATVAASADGKGKPEVTTAVKEAVKDGGKTASKEEVKKDGKTAAKVTKLPSGLTIEDRKVGTGPAAKAGNRLGMRYVGRLQGGKQFDANTKGKPFQFRLGKGEVISGWDEGLKGMQVGGERRLIVPPKMGYGARGAPPDIPGNATLVFDVKLVEIK